MKVLVLPSGGATGLILSATLAQIEADLGKPVYRLFDEIWSSSIGSLIGALLTLQEGPWAADEVTRILEKTFSDVRSAWAIRDQVKKWISPSVQIGDTLIPLRILTAQILRSKWGWPSETCLRSFSSKTDPQESLATLVSAACTVFPVHPFPEILNNLQLIDAGCGVCTESCMNPLIFFQEELLNRSQAEPVTVYFLSNGWVRLNENEIQSFHKDGIRIFNMDASLDKLIRRWKQESRLGSWLKSLSHLRTLSNLAGSGVLPASWFVDEARRMIREEKVYSDLRISLA